jgi:hypothetical protein
MPHIARDTTCLEYSVAWTESAILFVQAVGAIGRARRPELEAFATDHHAVRSVWRTGIGKHAVPIYGAAAVNELLREHVAD